MRLPGRLPAIALRYLCLWGGIAFLSACSSQRAQTPPPKPAPPPLEFLGEWGTRGDGPGQLHSPLSIAVDTVGNVYVADNRANSTFIHKFTHDGHPLLSFGVQVNSETPCALAVDRGGAIYLVKCHSGGLSIFYPDGSLLRTVRHGASRNWERPEGVAVDDEGNIYVVESRGHCVSKFNAAGRFLKSWGKEGSGLGELSRPSRVSIGPDGYLYVADTMNHRIQKFSGDGASIAAWPAPFSGQTPMFQGNATYGLAVSKDFVIASDSGSDHSGKQFLQFWTLDGQPRLTEDFLGRVEVKQHPVVVDVAVAPNGELLVLDGANARVLRFRINF